MTGVPFGAQTAGLSASNTGAPPTRIRVAPTTNFAVTQGVLSGGASGQPANV